MLFENVLLTTPANTKNTTLQTDELNHDTFELLAFGDLVGVVWKEAVKGQDLSQGVRCNFDLVPLTVPRNLYRIKSLVDFDNPELMMDMGTEPNGTEVERRQVMLFDNLEIVADNTPDQTDQEAVQKFSRTHFCRTLDKLLKTKNADGGGNQAADGARIERPGSRGTGCCGSACGTKARSSAFVNDYIAATFKWDETYIHRQDKSKDAVLHHFLFTKFRGHKEVDLVCMVIPTGLRVWVPVFQGEGPWVDQQLIENDADSPFVYTIHDITFIDGPDIFIGRCDFE